MRRRAGRLTCSAAAISVAVLFQDNTAAQQAIAVETAELVFDGKPSGQVAAGTAVKVIGEKSEEGLSLIRFTSPDGQEKMGLVRSDALVESKDSPPQETSIARSPAPQEGDDAISLGEEKQISATELAERLKANRDQFSKLAGRNVRVTGVVEEIRVLGKIGSMLTAEITLKTRLDLPKIRLLVHATEFIEETGGNRFEMRVQGKTLEGRARDTRYPYNYWYWNNGYWRSRSIAKSEWVPIISVGHPVNGSGVLSKYHINIDLEGAKIDKS
jgi:hypothetical protein